MHTDEPLARLMDDLAAARSFAGAARTLLMALRGTLSGAVRADPLLRDAQLLRGVLHLRPDQGYQGLILQEWTDKPADRLGAVRSSLTAWRELQRRRCPLLIDVDMSEFRSLRGDQWSEDTDEENGFGDTHHHLLARDVTHLFVAPLQIPGALRGMLTVEIGCLDAVGQLIDWRGWGAMLQRQIDLSALYLETLPHREAAPADDEALPYPHLGERMRALLPLLQVAAPVSDPLLLLGETGTGKSMLAEWIHARSGRRGKLVSASLNGLSESLALSRLFGAVKGAYTSAVEDAEGVLSAAEEGTLLLEEVDLLSPEGQAGLLRFLDTGRYARLGEARERSADVRLIATSNADLRALVRGGGFREDLYHRLNTLPLQLPPLRERMDELESWSRFLLSKTAARLAAAAIPLLQRSSWPGNLRELNQTLRRAALLARTRAVEDEVVVQVRDLQQAMRMDEELEHGILSPLQQAADAFFSEALRRARDETPALSLKDAEVFPGAVIAQALRRHRSPAEVAQALGLSSQIPRGNHLNTLRRHAERLAALHEKLGAATPEEFRALRKRGA